MEFTDIVLVVFLESTFSLSETDLLSVSLE